MSECVKNTRESRETEGSIETYLGAGVSAIANVNQVSQLWRIDLFILGSDQEGSDADKLELGSRDFALGEVSVNEVDGQVQRLGDKLEFQVDFYQPIDKDGSHAFVDVWLTFHVDWSHRRGSFLGAEMVVHVLDVSGHA